VAFGIVSGFLVNTVEAQNIPVPPLRIWGTVTSNLNNGYVIATTSNASCAKGAAFSGSSYGVSPNFLNFPGDIPGTTVVEGATNGETINVFIDSAEPSTAIYKTGGGIIPSPGAPVSATNATERLNVSIGTSANGAIYNVAGNVSSSGLGAVSDATVNINWGDGTACTQTFSSGGSYSGVHGYDEDGIYTITAIAYKNGVGAGMTTSLISVVTVVAVPTAAPSTGGGGFGPYIPPSGGGGARRATPTPTADELLELTVEESVDQFNDADAEAVAGWISKLSASRSAAIFELMETEKVIEVFATLTTETATEILDEILLSKAVIIMSQLGDEKAGEIFSSLATEKSADIFEQVSSDKLSTVIALMDSTVVADIFNYVNDEKTVSVFEKLETTKGAEILILVKLSKASNIIELIDVNKGALIFEVVETKSGASILDGVTGLKAADLLAVVSAQKAGSVMEYMAVVSVTSVIKYMPERKMIYRLPVMSAERFHQLPADVVLQVLPSVPAEAITKEISPVPVGKKPEVVLSTPGSSVYQQTNVNDAEWNTIISSPHPIDSVIAKFNEANDEIFITVEDQPIVSMGVPLDTGQLAYAGFSINFDGGVGENLSLGHIKFYVEKTWLDQKNIHKWSIQLKRFDEGLDRWVSYSAKRISEDEDKVYYTVVVPSFSKMAVVGSNTIPKPQFAISNLKITPVFPTAGEQFNITARVLNNSSDTRVYPANLWINDTIDSSQSIVLDPGQNTSFTFESNQNVGKYSLRIDRILASFQVRAKVVPVAVTPKPTPVAVPVIAPKPTPKPVDKATPTPAPTPAPKATATPLPKPTVAVIATATPVPTATTAPVVEETPIPEPTPTATATQIPVEEPIEEEESGGIGTALIIIIIVLVLIVLGGLGFVFMRGKGPNGPRSGNDSTSNKESNYTELDDLISGQDEENEEASK